MFQQMIKKLKIKKMEKKYLALWTLIIFAAANVSAASGPTNVVVDFDSTSFDSTLSPGDSGIMNLVVKNTGGYRADNVEVYIRSTATVNVDKRIFVGRLESDSEKSLPVVVRVTPSAKTGLTAVNVRIDYDGFKSDGTADNNLFTSWEVPLRIYGNPLFQLAPTKTSYYKDTLEDLTLRGTLMSNVKDLESTLSSSCVTVIGSSKQYLGNVGSGNTFDINYKIKPGSEGACSMNIKLDYLDESGQTATSNTTIGLNVEAAGVDFKVQSVGYEAVGPSEQTKLKIKLVNVGSAPAEEATVSIDLDEPFVPVDTTEKYVGQVKGGESIDVDFDVAVSWDAEIQPYAIPMTITYKVGGTSYSVEKDIGIDVSGSVILEVINVEQRSGSIRIDVANLGSRAAESVKAILVTGSPTNRSSYMRPSGDTSQNTSSRTVRSGSFNRSMSSSSSETLVEYKSDIKATKQTTFTFDTSYSGPVSLTLEYSGPNNKRVSVTERLNAGSESSGTTSSRSSRFSTSTSSGGYTTYLYYGLGAVILILAYKRLRK